MYYGLLQMQYFCIKLFQNNLYLVSTVDTDSMGI